MSVTEMISEVLNVTNNEMDIQTFLKHAPLLKADGSLFTVQKMSQFFILACCPIIVRTDIDKH